MGPTGPDQTKSAGSAGSARVSDKVRGLCLVGSGRARVVEFSYTSVGNQKCLINSLASTYVVVCCCETAAVCSADGAGADTCRVRMTRSSRAGAVGRSQRDVETQTSSTV